jgi:hypothetical protein
MRSHRTLQLTPVRVRRPDRSNIANQEAIAKTFAEIKDVAKSKGMTIGVVFNCAGIQQRTSAYEYKQVRLPASTRSSSSSSVD